MAKKVNNTFKGTLWKNLNKGGAWQLEIAIVDDSGSHVIDPVISPWANASAAKRDAKDKVVEFTPRKSVKWVPDESIVDAKGKVAYYRAEMTYKVDA